MLVAAVPCLLLAAADAWSQQSETGSTLPPGVVVDPLAGKPAPRGFSGDIEDQVSLGAGEFQVIKLRGKPDYYLVSANGRFVVSGLPYDLWQGKQLESIADVTNAIREAHLPDLVKLLPELAPFQIGSGPKTEIVFVDPHCPFCAQLLGQISQLAQDNRHSFMIVPIGVLGQQSQIEVRQLHCAQDQAAALQSLMAHDYTTKLPQVANCDPLALQKRVVLARLLPVKAVPYIIRDDGVMQEGMPPNVRLWLEAAR